MVYVKLLYTDFEYPGGPGSSLSFYLVSIQFPELTLRKVLYALKIIQMSIPLFNNTETTGKFRIQRPDRTNGRADGCVLGYLE